MKGDKRQTWERVGIISALVMMFMALFGAVLWRTVAKSEDYQAEQADLMGEAEELLVGLYTDYEHEVPALGIYADQIEEVEDKLSRVAMQRHEEAKAEMRHRLGDLRELVQVREKLEKYFANDVLRLGTTAEDVQGMEAKLAELPESYAGALRARFERMREQYQAMVGLKMAVIGLFTDEKMNVVNPRLTRAEYKMVVEQAKNLPQRELAESYDEILARVGQVLTQREKEAAEARQRALEAKRRADELRKKREKEISAAWKILSVPYHSQNLQKIYNGCEAASMLMALQYKGYLKGVDLYRYAEMMPKSDDYNIGFVGSIYDLQPKTYVHWIAPAPLAKFGRESSGNPNVVDMTGASLADLDKEVLAGNPVIIYVTFLFNPLKEWLNGAPKNLHVVLLTGYNPETGTQRLTDPWTQSDGGRTYDLSKQELEQIYNAVGKRAVVVR